MYPWQRSTNRMFTPLPIKVYTSLNDSQKTFKCCFFVNTPLYIFYPISFTFITQYTGHVNQNMYNFPFFLVWFYFIFKKLLVPTTFPYFQCVVYIRAAHIRQQSCWHSKHCINGQLWLATCVFIYFSLATEEMWGRTVCWVKSCTSPLIQDRTSSMGQFWFKR